MPNFIPGLQLSEEFFNEAVAPILAADFRDVPYSAALLGSIDQFSHNTDLASDPRWRFALRNLWLAEEVQSA